MRRKEGSEAGVSYEHRPDASARLALDSTDTSDGDELTFQVAGARRLAK